MFCYFAPFGFESRSKLPPLEILKYIFATLINQDNKVLLIIVDEDGALARSGESLNTCHKMNIISQTTGGYASSLNGKVKVLIRPLLVSQELLYWTQDTINNFGDFPIIMSYVSPAKLRIGCVVMFLTSSGMEQDLHTNTLKYGVWEST